MFWFATSSTRRCSSLSAMSAPVGLQGELMMMAFVLGVMACEERVRVHRNAVFRVHPHEHRLRAGELHLLGDCRPAGYVVITSLAGLKSAIATL